jgi:hypothetical protein
MTVTAKPLVAAKYAEATETTQYGPVATGVRTIIDKVTATNVTAAPATITLRLVPSGGTPGPSNTITLTKTLAAGEVYPVPEAIGHILGSGEFISTLAGTASAIVLRISGREVS